jgi:hypothetical protein
VVVGLRWSWVVIALCCLHETHDHADAQADVFVWRMKQAVTFFVDAAVAGLS